MSKLKKISIILILLLLLQLSIIIKSVYCTEAIFSGVDISENGDGSVIAKLSTDKKTLTISGTGKMTEYSIDGVTKYSNTITKVVIKQGVTNIRGYFAKDWEKLNSVTIPNSVTIIGEKAFYHCDGLTSITIPSSVTKIGNSAFEFCYNLKTVKILGGSVGNLCFHGCSKMSSLSLENGVIGIGKDAFLGCIGITRVIIPGSVTSIGNEAFQGCANMETMYIPDSVKSIGNNALFFDLSLNYEEKGVTIKCKKGSVAETVVNKYIANRKAGKNGSNVTIYKLSLDNTAPTLTGPTYSTTAATKSNVKVTIKGNEALQGITGWTLSSDRKTLTKTYSSNVSSTKVTVKDLVGNSKTVTVKIANIDKTAPKLSSLNVTSPNAGTYKAGQTITIVATFSENIYKDASKGAVVAATAPLKIKFGSGTVRTATFSKVSGKTITYTYKIASGDAGKLAISSYSGTVYDVAGNSLKITNKTIGGNAITADTTAPTLTSLNITSPNAGIYKAGQTITIVATFSENIYKDASKGVVVAATAPLKIVFGSGTVRTATFNSTSGKTITYTYEIVTGDVGKLTISSYSGTVYDAVGNSLKITNKTIEGNAITADTVIPIATVNYSTTNLTQDNVTVTITANEKIQEVEGWKLSEDAKTLTKTYTVNESKEITIYDLVGNSSNVSVRVLNIDKTQLLTNIQYSTIKPTNKDVTATIIANMEIEQVEGWKISEDKKTLTKTYTENKEEEITINGKNGSSKKVNVKVGNIDKTAPVLSEPNYSTTELTNENIIVTIESNEKIQEVEGWNLSADKKQITREYIANVEEEIEVYDLAGNSSKVNVKIANIDNTQLHANVKYSTIKPTNKDVTATIIANMEIEQVEEWEISEDKKTLTKTYTENKEEEVIINGKNGSSKKVNVKVGNIDKTAPVLSAPNYSTTNLTQDNVTVTITANEEIQEVEGWNLSADKKQITKEYIANAEEEIEVYDLAGNSSKVNVKIANIDNTQLHANVKYSTTKHTNTDVVVTIESNKELKEVEGWNLSEDKKTLTKTYTGNKEEEVIIYDLVGNSKKISIGVSNIDKDKANLEINYSTTKKTNNNITVTIRSNKELKSIDGWRLSEDKKTLIKEYTENTTENIEVTDTLGNIRNIEIKIENIDKTIPELHVSTELSEEKNSCKVDIISNKELSELEGWNLSADKKKLTRVYVENIEEEITVKDIVGNENTINVEVSGIEKIFDINYEIEEDFIYNIQPNTTYNEFAQNINSNTEYELKDNENKIEETDIVKTGQTITVGEDTYMLVVAGDVNGDGKADIKDILRINRHRLNKNNLTDCYLQAGDVNEDGKADIKDLLRINRYRLGKINEL